MANKAQGRRSKKLAGKYEQQKSITLRNKRSYVSRIARRKKNPCPKGRKGAARRARRETMRKIGIPKPWTLDRWLNPQPEPKSKQKRPQHLIDQEAALVGEIQ